MTKPNSLHSIRRSEDGAVIVESIPALLIFLTCLMVLLELCRFSYYSLATQFFLVQSTRFASVAALEEAALDGQACCIQRVNRIKQWLADDLSEYYVRLNPATEIFVCDSALADCNICDDPSQPPLPQRLINNGFGDTAGPGFVRNRIVQLRVVRNVSLFIPIENDLWTMDRSALGKLEAGIKDCPV